MDTPHMVAELAAVPEAHFDTGWLQYFGANANGGIGADQAAQEQIKGAQPSVLMPCKKSWKQNVRAAF